MSRELGRLIEILTLERLGEESDVYRGIGSENDGAEATFGGHFLGQATRAALMTVDDGKGIHSLHGYFLRGGIPGEPIDYHVTRVRDGRSFCTRRLNSRALPSRRRASVMRVSSAAKVAPSAACTRWSGPV